MSYVPNLSLSIASSGYVPSLSLTIPVVDPEIFLTSDHVLTQGTVTQTHTVSAIDLNKSGSLDQGSYTVPDPTLDSNHVFDQGTYTQTHILTANDLNQSGGLSSGTYALQDMTLDSDHVLEQGTYTQIPFIQAIDLNSVGTMDLGRTYIYHNVSANEMSQSGTLSASYTQIHSISALPLSSSSTLEQGDVTHIHSIVAVELTAVSNSLVTGNFEQSHYVIANELTSNHWLDVMNKNHTAIVYSPENQSTSVWSNMPFIGSHVLNGKTLFISSDGLFEFGGVTDNGCAINPSLKTGKMNGVDTQNGFSPSNHLKRIPKSKIYINASKKSGELDLTVTADNDSYTYNNQVAENNYATHSINIGRGIKYNYLQLNIVGNGCQELHIDNIDFDSTELIHRQR